MKTDQQYFIHSFTQHSIRKRTKQQTVHRMGTPSISPMMMIWHISLSPYPFSSFITSHVSVNKEAHALTEERTPCGCTLQHSNLQKEATHHLVLRLRGGFSDTPSRSAALLLHTPVLVMLFFEGIAFVSLLHSMQSIRVSLTTPSSLLSHISLAAPGLNHSKLSTNNQNLTAPGSPRHPRYQAM